MYVCYLSLTAKVISDCLTFHLIFPRMRQMSFYNFLSYHYYPSFFNGTWLSDTELLFRDQVSKTFILLSITNTKNA